MIGLEGKVTIVTGGGSGIGRAVTVRLVDEGTHVVVFDINRVGGDETVALAEGRGTCRFVEGSVTDQAALGAAVAAANEAGPIWALVNCADSTGQVHSGPPEELDLKDWQQKFDVGVTGTFLACRAVFPDMKERGGRIINFGSQQAEMPFAGNTAGACVKGAIRSLTRALAREWGKYGITVNTVVPSAVTASYERWREARPEQEQFVRDQMPLKRTGRPDADVAPLVAFYLSEEAGWTTGVILLANGGRLMF